MNTAKKILISIGIVLTILILAVGLLVAVFSSGKVQTAVIGVVAEQLSRGLNAKVEVKEVDYHIPNNLLIRGVYIEDQFGDTLLYVDTLKARCDISALLCEDRLHLKEIALCSARGFAHKVPSHNALLLPNDTTANDSVMNYQFLIEAFKKDPKDKKEKKTMPIELAVDQIAIERTSLVYNDWKISHISTQMAVNQWSTNKIEMALQALSLTLDRQGQRLPIQNAEAQLLITDSLICMPKVCITLPNSNLKASGLQIMRHDSLPLVGIAAHIEKIHLSPADLAIIAPKFTHFNGYFDVVGDLEGRIDSLHAQQVSLSFNKQRILLGDITAVGMPNIDSLYLRAECQDFFINKGLLQDIISDLKNKPYQLPVFVSRLGNVHYRGLLEGHLESLTLQGAFTSALGTLTTNGRATTDSRLSELAFVGEIATTKFALGKLLGQKKLGATSLRLRINGHVAENHAFHGNVNGKVGLLHYNDYTYKNIKLDGEFRHKIFAGSVVCDDPNLTFAFNGRANLNDIPSYEMQLRMQHLRLGQLNFSKRYTDSDLQLTTNWHFVGKTIDDMVGEATIDSLLFTNGEKNVKMDELIVRLERNAKGTMANGHALPPVNFTIVSDFLTAGIAGEYQPSTLPIALQKMAIRYLPSLFTPSYKQHILAQPSHNELHTYLYLTHLDQIFAALDLPFSVPNTATIKGSLSERKGTISLLAGVPDAQAKGQHLENIALNFGNEKGPLSLGFSCYRHHGKTKAGKHIGDLKLYLGMQAEHDSLFLACNWNNLDTIRHAGDIRMAAGIVQYNRKPLINVHLLPTNITLADSVWQISESDITYAMADTSITIANFRLGNNSQYILANGIISPREEDTIRAELKQIDLDYFLGSLTDVHNSIYFGGLATGWAQAYGLLTNPMFEANVEMKHAEINGVEVGDAYAKAYLNEEKQVVIEGQVKEQLIPKGKTDSIYRTIATLDGTVVGKNWDLQIQADSVRLGFINYFTQGIITDIDGRASGHVRVFGDKTYVGVRVAAKPHNAGISIPFTGGRYYTSDSIFLDSTAIIFHNISLHDIEGNPLHLNGEVTHNGDWKDINYRFKVRAKHAICLNLPESYTDFYSGKIYGTGEVNIAGDEHLCNIDAQARTDAGSSVIISVAGASTASESDFIEFINHRQTTEKQQQHAETLGDMMHARGTDINLNLNIEATPQVLARVIIDSRTGDQLKGRGEGNVRISYNSKTGASMFGGFSLLQGTFSFTLQNVIRREFDICEGSTVTWTGDPETPTLNVRALYRTTASLRDLFGTDADEIFTQRTSVPVNCVLMLSNNLMNPTINFGIELPSSDEMVQTQIHSIINTEDMLTREVIYLLVFNKFYTPEYLQATPANGLNETYSLLSSTITGQINSWLGKVTDAFSLGFNFRNDGEGANASQEYEAQFEIHPVRGLLINGNVGYRYNDIANQPIFGNLDIEYMLTSNGKIRAKAYTHTVDRYSLRQANTMQGVGLVFKHDFNWTTKEQRAAEKAKRKEEREQKKEEKNAAKKKQDATKK